MADVTATDVQLARVTVTIDGDDLELRPTPNAILALSAEWDGFSPLISALQRMSVKAAISVIVAGAGIEGKAAKDAPAKIATAGMSNLLAPLIEFVLICANGGKPLGGDTESGDKGPQ
jgi:hypothetical protein